MFLDEVVFPTHPNAMSLNDHCMDLKNNFNIDISKQGLQQRFNRPAVDFIETILKNYLKDMSFDKIMGSDLNQFTSVLIKDSTRFQVDEELSEYFPGSTGSATGAGIHIQYEFDLLTGKLNDLTLSDALRQDSTDARQSIELIPKGALVLRDMGYFNLEVFKSIADRGAFFLSRLNASVSIFEQRNEKDVELTVDDILRKVNQSAIKRIDLNVKVGTKAKFPVRMVVEKLPSKERSEKLKKLRQLAQKKQRTISEEYIKWAGLQILITNIPAAVSGCGNLKRIYKLRWQIELIFKTWKSIGRIDKTGKVNQHRLLCYLYGALLYMMINWEIFYALQIEYMRSTGNCISIQKFYKACAWLKEKLREAFMRCPEKADEYIMHLEQNCKRHLKLEAKKNREGLEEILKMHYK
jgi:hypothetical protein